MKLLLQLILLMCAAMFYSRITSADSGPPGWHYDQAQTPMVADTGIIASSATVEAKKLNLHSTRGQTNQGDKTSAAGLSNNVSIDRHAGCNGYKDDPHI